jgi:hypothetical protein
MVNWEPAADRGPHSPIRPRARGGDDSINLVLTERRSRSLLRKLNRRHPADLPLRTNWADTPHMRGLASMSLYRRYRYEPRRPPHHPPSTICLPPRILPARCSPLDPITARLSPIGDGSRPERGPQHTGLLVSRYPHRGTSLPRASRLSADATPHIPNTLRGLGCVSRCYHASDLAHRPNKTSLLLPIFRRGQRHSGSHTSAASRGRPTRGPSSCTRPFPSEPSMAANRGSLSLLPQHSSQLQEYIEYVLKQPVPVRKRNYIWRPSNHP